MQRPTGFLRKARAKLAAATGPTTPPPPPPDSSSDEDIAVDASPPDYHPSQPPPPPSPTSPNPMDRLSSLTNRTSARHSTASSPPTTSSASTGLVHSLKVVLKADNQKKLLASSASLAEADKLMSSLMTTFPSLLSAIDANAAAIAQVADTHRIFRLTVAPIYLPDDEAHDVVNTFTDATAPLLDLDTADGSYVSDVRADARAALTGLIDRINALQLVHNSRVATTREKGYYADKVRALAAAAKPKEQEKCARNQQKLTELSNKLEVDTEDFYTELREICTIRGAVADKALRAFVVTQSALLKPYGVVDEAMRAAAIGDRATPPTPAPPAMPDGEDVYKLAHSPPEPPAMFEGVENAPPPPPPPPADGAAQPERPRDVAPPVNISPPAAPAPPPGAPVPSAPHAALDTEGYHSASDSVSHLYPSSSFTPPLYPQLSQPSQSSTPSQSLTESYGPPPPPRAPSPPNGMKATYID